MGTVSTGRGFCDVAGDLLEILGERAFVSAGELATDEWGLDLMRGISGLRSWDMGSRVFMVMEGAT
jgi:hypothetical protein